MTANTAELKRTIEGLFEGSASFASRLAAQGRSQRVLSPRRTTTLLRRYARALGVTRLADLAPLDAIGLPVFLLAVPRADDITEHYSCGKGPTRAAAIASALMEALEYRAILAVPPHMIAEKSAAEMRRRGRAFAPGDPDFQPATPLKPADTLDWVEGLELSSCKRVFLPLGLMTAVPRVSPRSRALRLFRNSEGVAAGNSPYEAIAHAVYELVERDAVILSSFGPQRPLDAATIPAASAARVLLRKIAAARCRAFVFDITTDVGLPAFCAYIAEQCSFDAAHVHQGFGCHHRRETALIKALHEACQTRLAYFAGSREDVEGGTEGLGDLQGLKADSQAYPAARYDEIPDYLFEDLADALAFASSRLSAAGLRKIFIANISLPNIPFPVVKCLIPGLEGTDRMQNGQYLPGERAKKRIARHGVRDWKY